MDTMTALLTRRSTRNYLPKPVEGEKLDKLLAAARQAPSGGNNQTNHFLVIQNRDVLDKLVGMTESAFAEMEVDEDTYSSLRHAILASPVFKLDNGHACSRPPCDSFFTRLPQAGFVYRGLRHKPLS